MEALLSALINGLALGMAYALISVGYSIVFGILRLINFSHSSVYAFGAYMVYFFVSLQVGLLWSIIIAIALAGLLGCAIDKTALEPLRKKNSLRIATLITTIGISNIITEVLSLEGVFGTTKRGFPSLNLFDNIVIGNITIQSSQVIMFAAALVLLCILTLVVNKTKVGLAMRATEQNIRAAQIMGVDVNKVIMFSFFMSGASAAIAGTLIGGYYQMISPSMGATIGMKSFSAAVVGGIGVLYGAVVGGLVVGVAECVAAQFLGSNVRDPMAFVLLLLILIFKPNGLFGKQTISKV